MPDQNLNGSAEKLNGELQVQANSSKYYSKRYSGLGLRYHEHCIRNLVGELNGKTLDVGCGTGIMASLFPNRNIVGVDPSGEMLQYYKGSRFIQCFADKTPFGDSTFDNIVCRSVLHHVESPDAVLKECFRVLKPGGHIYIWETNKSWLATFIRSLTQHGDRFSEYHTAFSNLPVLVHTLFNVTEVKYEGFLAYVLLGFPDIFNTHLPRFAFRFLIAIDELLSRSFLKKWSFAIAIKARKSS